MNYHRSAVLLVTALVLATGPNVLLGDENPIFGQIAGLGCTGSGPAASPGFAIKTFALSDAATASSAGSTGKGSGLPTFPDIRIVKGLDDCTPLLFGGVARENHFTSGTITVYTPGGTSKLLLVELTDVFLTGDTFTEGAANELDELVTVTYSKIRITHIPSGKTFGWDVKAGKAF